MGGAFLGGNYGNRPSALPCGRGEAEAWLQVRVGVVGVRARLSEGILLHAVLAGANLGKRGRLRGSRGQVLLHAIASSKALASASGGACARSRGAGWTPRGRDEPG